MQSVPIAIVAALSDELRIIRSKMDVDSRVHVRPALFEIGTYLGKPILLARSGIGREAMEKAAGYLFAHYSTKFCLHVGYCGAADPFYQVGDLIVVSRVVDAANGDVCEIGVELVGRAEKVCRENGLRAKIGPLATVNRVISSPHEKAFVGTEHEVQCLDMEGFDLVKACKNRGVPCLVVRAVTDPLDVEMPDMGGVIDSSGQAGGLAVAEHIVRHPKDLLKLPRLQYFISQARLSITAFIDAWIKENQ